MENSYCRVEHARLPDLTEQPRCGVVPCSTRTFRRASEQASTQTERANDIFRPVIGPARPHRAHVVHARPAAEAVASSRQGAGEARDAGDLELAGVEGVGPGEATKVPFGAQACCEPMVTITSSA